MSAIEASAEKPAQAAVSDYFGVRRFDAVGDVKTDDTAVFQKALNAALFLVSRNGTV